MCQFSETQIRFGVECRKADSFFLEASSSSCGTYFGEMQSTRKGDETASNASTTAPNAHRSSVSSWMSNLQRRLLRAAPSVKPTSKRPKLHSPIILRALTDLPAPTKAPLSEPAYRNCDSRLAPAIQRPDRRRSSIAKM